MDRVSRISWINPTQAWQKATEQTTDPLRDPDFGLYSSQMYYSYS